METISSTNDLIELLGHADFIRLVENYAGCRLFIRSNIRHSTTSDNISVKTTFDNDPLAEAIGEEAARKLEQHLGGCCIRVPLARELRARHYRKQGMTNAKIAVRIGMTESGVEGIFKRLRAQRSARAENQNTTQAKKARQR